jgi:hypothetical protein
VDYVAAYSPCRQDNINDIGKFVHGNCYRIEGLSAIMEDVKGCTCKDQMARPSQQRPAMVFSAAAAGFW